VNAIENAQNGFDRDATELTPEREMRLEGVSELLMTEQQN